MSVIEIIRYNIASGAESAFEEAYSDAGQFLRQSPHCLAYQITRCVEEHRRYIVRIEWDSLEDHMQGFRQSPTFRQFFALVRPYFDAIEEMQHCEELTSYIRS